MRLRIVLALLLASAALLTSCAPAADPSWRPLAWDSTDIFDVVPPAPLDPATLTGIVEHRLRNDDVDLHARFALLPGRGAVTDPFNATVVALVRQAIDARAQATSIAYAPQAHDTGAGLGARGCVPGATLRPAAELLADPATGPSGGAGTLVVCDIIAASGSFLGQRVRVVTGGPDGVASDTPSTLYVDTQTGEVAPAAGLWSADAARVIAGDVIEAMRRQAGALSLAPVADDPAAIALVQAALETTVPTAGSMIVTLPVGFTADVLVGLGVEPTTTPTPVTVRVSTGESLLSEIGARLLATSGDPYTGPSRAGAGLDWMDCTLLPCVALTYDDGPSAYTAGILDALLAQGAAATFFVQGMNMSTFADVTRRAVSEGNVVENHSWNHPKLPSLTSAQVSRQISDTNAAILAATGVPATAFRPPYGEYSASVLAAARMPAILWDVDVRDWAGLADDALVAQAVTEPRPGSIVLQHDVQPNTARTVGTVYEGLRDRGFSLVTVQQLFPAGVPSSGAWRSAR